MKPLFYGWDGTCLWFGSELKSLRAFRHWTPEIDRTALVHNIGVLRARGIGVRHSHATGNDCDVTVCELATVVAEDPGLIESFESDIVIMDYRVRGFTRDVRGRKHYIDHKINSIQDYLSKSIQKRYEMFDVNVYQENIFHTKMHLKEFDLDRYLFEEKARNLSFKERMKIEARLKREIEELYHGRNLVD